MKFFKSATEKLFTKKVEYKLHEKVVQDLTQGKRDLGVWGKAFVEADGDEEKAKSLYIKLMVQHYKDIAKSKAELEAIWKGSSEYAQAKKKEEKLREEQRKKEREAEVNKLRESTRLEEIRLEEERLRKEKRIIEKAKRDKAKTPSNVMFQANQSSKLNSLTDGDIGSGCLKFFLIILFLLIASLIYS